MPFLWPLSLGKQRKRPARRTRAEKWRDTAWTQAETRRDAPTKTAHRIMRRGAALKNEKRHGRHALADPPRPQEGQGRRLLRGGRPLRRRPDHRPRRGSGDLPAGSARRPQPRARHPARERAIQDRITDPRRHSRRWPDRLYVDRGVEISTLDKTEQKAEKERLAKPTRLEQTRLSKRRPAWVLFLVILVFGLVLPMIGHFVPGFGELLRHTPLPSTQSWNPGPLDAAHGFFGGDCQRCHQHAFLTVRDAACLACHANTPAHADPAKYNLPQLGNAECRSCHQDHQGARGLIRTDQRLCADCHGDLKTRTRNASQFEDVRDFGTAHPEFKLLLPAWDANGRFAPQRVTFAPDLKENSGLKFNHAKHLKPDGVNAPQGHRVLDCGDCHVPDAGGAKMRPVNFATMCHDCHTLGFDPLAPGREVPHGKVSEVIYTLNEYYARVALEGGYQDAKSPVIVQERRRPGAPPLSQQQQQEALAWAREQARSVTESLFTGRACTTCHKVSPPRDAADTWHVAPVRVSGVWYADAKFTHAKHTTVKCEDCHDKARDSKTASDLLIPGISNCRTCHAGAYAK